jgi:exodeoxyribonuclease-3
VETLLYKRYFIHFPLVIELFNSEKKTKVAAAAEKERAAAGHRKESSNIRTNEEEKDEIEKPRRGQTAKKKRFNHHHLLDDGEEEKKFEEVKLEKPLSNGQTESFPAAAGVDTSRISLKDLIKIKEASNNHQRMVMNAGVIHQQDNNKLPIIISLGNLSEKKNNQQPQKIMRICSWNVSSIRTLLSGTDLEEYIKQSNPDILFLLELRIDQESFQREGLEDKLAQRAPNYVIHINCITGARKGYSGTAVLIKSESNYTAPITVQKGMKHEDNEGRLIMLEYPQFYLVGVYAPNTGGSELKLSKRLNEWDPQFLDYLRSLQAKNNKEIIIIGDLNVSHTDLDIHESLVLESKGGGCNPEERAKFTKLLVTGGFVDTYRHLNPGKKSWTQWNRYRGRDPDIGRRLDYALVTNSLMPKIHKSLIRSEVKGSDHCPIEIHLLLLLP